MEVHYVWPGCWRWPRNPTAFWVAATEDEAREFFFDKLSEEDKEEFNAAAADIDYLDGWYRGAAIDKYDDDRFRFLVAVDLSNISLGFGVYPYSGMWNGRGPFKGFRREISSPEELRNLL